MTLTKKDKDFIIKDLSKWSGGYELKELLWEWEDKQDEIDNTPAVMPYIEFALPSEYDKNEVVDWLIDLWSEDIQESAK